MTRPGAESWFMNGLLDEEQLITTTVRRNGFSQAPNSFADRSGPRKLNFASLPSNVPWPISTNHNSPVPVFGSFVKACFRRDKSDVSLVAPEPTIRSFALAWEPAFSQSAAASEKSLPNSSSPAAPTAMITVT